MSTDAPPAIRIFFASAAPPAHVSPDSAYLAGAASEHTLRVLSSMSVRTLRLKLLKACKVPRAQHAAARLWMVLPGGECVELTDEYAARDLAYWGVDADTRFVLVAET